MTNAERKSLETMKRRKLGYLGHVPSVNVNTNCWRRSFKEKSKEKGFLDEEYPIVDGNGVSCGSYSAIREQNNFKVQYLRVGCKEEE